MCKKIVGKRFPISSLTIFSHYPDEYSGLVKILQKMGDPCGENNGVYFLLANPVKAQNNLIKHVRVRLPDPYRMHVGCNAFDINDYEDFKNKNLKQHPQNMRLVKRPEYEMIEFFDPDFDVLAYAVSCSVIKKL